VTARLAVPALIAPAATLALGVDGSLTRLDGVLILVVFAVATVGLIVGAPAAPPDPAPRSARAAFARLGAGLAGLTICGALLGEGLTRSDDGLGLSEALLGNTVVAASVEAEEVVRVVTPARRGRGDLGLANVLGTIVHFAALNAGVIALVRPLELSSDTVRYFLPAPLAATAILLGLLAWRGALSRLAGIGLLALYGAYVAAAVAIGLD
jgi:cation:H+ antiporter